MNVAFLCNLAKKKIKKKGLVYRVTVSLGFLSFTFHFFQYIFYRANQGTEGEGVHDDGFLHHFKIVV